jgi:hypothetical protein
VVHFPSGLLRWRLRLFSTFYPLLRFLRIWAISGDVPFVFSMKETVLPPLSCFLVFAPVLPLIVFLAFVLLVRRLILLCLQHLLPLLAASFLFYVEILSIRGLLRL